VRYTGPRIGLNFQKQDVRTILQILADALGFNVVMDDSIKGDLAMRLDNVPADQALDIILRTKELGKIQEGNVMLIEPLAKINKRREEALKAAKSQETLAPLTSEIVQINFAKADEIATLLKSKDTGLLSDRGRISVDPRTNTLLIQETRDRLADIRKLIAQLDIAVRQVLIESRIVVANKDFSRTSAPASACRIRPCVVTPVWASAAMWSRPAACAPAAHWPAPHLPVSTSACRCWAAAHWASPSCRAITCWTLSFQRCRPRIAAKSSPRHV
jgi:type II secretory pathway component GspD/PulD (secretin)